MSSKKNLIIVIVVISLIGFWFAQETSATYQTSGNFTSTNLLTGQTVVSIDSFVYNLSAKPSGTGATIQFSQNGSSWYNSSGVLGGTNTLTTGTNNSIGLSGLAWTGANFYYKVAFTSDGTGTPVLDDITLNFTSPVSPTVTTQAASSVEATTATGNGNITATGGATVTRRGFAYMVGTSGDPTTANSVAYDDGSFGTGAYTKGLTGLSTGTSYRIRAYAVNFVGTSYGTTVQILTKSAPTITTSAASSITVITAILNGNVTAIGGENPTVTVYWGDNDGGTTPGNWDNSSVPTSPSQPQGVAAFTKNVTGLSPGTTYYFSAEATNSGGTSWGTTQSFNTAFPPCIDHNVSGWAWSSNIGWISFSCENETEIGTGVDYGVDINEDTGIFSGYAWSENIGWIDFVPSGPYPDTPDYSTKVDTGNGEVSGWARALAYGDGWDGWIRLRDTDYGVWLNSSVSPTEFRDWAWSDMVIGWISFSGSNYKVVASIIFGPGITNFDNSFTPCVQSRIPTFSWETDAEMPYDYEIQLCSNSDCTGGSDPLVSELKENTSSTSWTPACTYTCDIAPYNNINFGGGTYYGQVRARNLGGEWSGWTSSSFTTHSHAYPYADFLCEGEDCSGMEIDEEVVITLSNNSTTYDGVLSCSWDLPAIAEVLEGNPLSDCTLKVKFSAPAPGQREQDITFTVTDSSSYSCSATKTVTIQFPLPEYKEVPPVSWLKNFFAKVADIFAGF